MRTHVLTKIKATANNHTERKRERKETVLPTIKNGSSWTDLEGGVRVQNPPSL